MSNHGADFVFNLLFIILLDACINIFPILSRKNCELNRSSLYFKQYFKIFFFELEMITMKLQRYGNIMKTGKFWVFAGLIITAAFIISCSDKKAIDFGEFENGTYYNSFFNLMLSIPDTWEVLDLESRMELMKQGGKIVAGDNRNLKAAIEAADLKSLNLLTAYEYPPGVAVSSNPGIMLIAEKIKHAPGIRRGSDYHYQAQKLMKLSRMQVSYPEDIYETVIDGVSFDVMEAEITLGPGVVIWQRQYATIVDDYALLLALTYQDEYGLGQLEEIVGTITFN